jgi:5'(3')-deoxyribonucleotidase
MLSSQSTPRRKIIAVDMDEVIADALGEHLLRYNRDFRTHLTVADLHGRWLWDVVPPAHQATLEQYMLSEDFFSALAVMPDAQRVLARLQSQHEIFIASAAMEVPSSFMAKFDWLAEHFPFIPTSHIVFCGDKSILRADFLIDDNPRQLRRFEERDANDLARTHDSAVETGPQDNLPREGILFTSPANAFVSGFRRVDSWLDVERLFFS